MFGWSEFRVKVFGLSTFCSVLASNWVGKGREGDRVYIYGIAFLERAGVEVE